MKFSENWLREWVQPELTTHELSEQLSMAGLEVDEQAPVAGEFSGVLVGEVLECGQHPDADKLRVTKINVGGDQLLDIVCGAPNCRQGLKVAVATVGAVLPGNFKIKKAKLRGAPSFGMLCSFSELGISDDHDGIIELPLDAPIGQDVRSYLGLNDSAIEIDLTPNRADCLSIRGVAREVGVLNNIDVCEPEINAVSADIDDEVEVVLSTPQACPRYLSRVIRNIDVKAKSPLWLTEKLRRSGIRSIDPIVDVTNFVLLELGHPMHAFDLATIEGNINVRLAKPDEKLVLLDESEVTLTENTLVIADQKKALAMAGIFGGLHSGVTDKTTDIMLESAFFAPEAISGRARQYGLHTDASHRYERGVDPQLQKAAMERASALILSICGGEIGPIVEAVDEKNLPVRQSVTLRKSRLTRVVGHEYDTQHVTNCLTRLGMTVSFENECWAVIPPSYRFDINIEEDLIEEVVRVSGYNKIPNLSPVASLTMSPSTESTRSLKTIKSVLLAKGYQEAITYSFVDPKIQHALFPDSNGLVLPHPISADMSVMRVSLWPGLLGAAAYNQKRQQARIRLFETGLRFMPDESAPQAIAQERVVAGVLAGSRSNIHWDTKEQALDFFDAKADVEALLKGTGCLDSVAYIKASHSALHPGMSAKVVLNGREMGWLGAIHPEFSKLLGITGRVFVFELELESLEARELPSAKPISKYPSNRRDIAVVVADTVLTGDILSFIQDLGVNQLVGLNLFDVYTGSGIEPGFKSLALSLILQDADKTLEDSEIQKAVDTVINGLASEFNASLRE
jgi:phenylalanyl-tRNA synthetase beta chain